MRAADLVVELSDPPHSQAAAVLRDLANQLEKGAVIQTDFDVGWLKVNGRDHFTVTVKGFQPKI